MLFLNLVAGCGGERLKGVVVVKHQYVDDAAAVGHLRCVHRVVAACRAGYVGQRGLKARRGHCLRLGSSRVVALVVVAEAYRLLLGANVVFVATAMCALDFSILRRLSNRRRVATVRIWNKHVSVAKHEPHDVELRVGIVDLGDDLVAHLLVPAVEQLRQGGTRYVAHVGKLGVGNPVLV